MPSDNAPKIITSWSDAPDVASPESEAQEELREVVDQSRSGAPAAGAAVSDIFSTDEIYARLMATAHEEFSRSNRLLFLSGLAAGLSIGLTLLGHASVAGFFPDEPRPLLSNVLYPVGFLFIILGRYQLFTENTLTPVTLVLPRLASIPRLLKIWAIVYTANLLGATGAAYVFARTGVFEPEAAAAAYAMGAHAMEVAWEALFWKGVVAGWLVAGMVWILHAARDTITRFVVVYFIMYLVPTAGLYHCVISACELAYYVFEGGATFAHGFLHFQAPVALGNTVGGVLLVAILNYFQTQAKRFGDFERLGRREWLLGLRKDATFPFRRLAGFDHESREASQ